MDLARLSRWEKVAGAAAIALVVSMFAPWWQLEVGGGLNAESPGASAWEGFGGIDIVLLLAGLAVAGLVLAKASGRTVQLPVSTGLAVAALGALSGAFALYAVVDPPDILGAGEADTALSPSLFEDTSPGIDAGIPGLLEITSGAGGAGVEVVPVFAVVGLLLAGLIALAGWRLAQVEGASFGAQAAAPQPQPAAPAPKPAAADAARERRERTPAERHRRMSWVMVGCGAAVAVAAFLPWGSAVGETWSGFEWSWLGKVTLLTGLALCAYGAQGLRAQDPRVRHHGWAIALIVVLLLTASLAWTTLDTLSLGIGLVEPGTGLMITLVAGVAAIWPLVVLRRAARAPDPVSRPVPQ